MQRFLYLALVELDMSGCVNEHSQLPFFWLNCGCRAIILAVLAPGCVFFLTFERVFVCLNGEPKPFFERNSKMVIKIGAVWEEESAHFLFVT